jgi:hypothetical protein
MYNIQGTHVYPDEGNFPVTVSVTDTGSTHDMGGNAASTTVTVTVQETLLPGGGRGTADQRFISEVYHDLLGRQVDAAGLAGWAGYLQGHSRTDFVTALTNSTEFRAIEVQHLYQQYLHRAADPGGLSAGIAFLAGGGTVEQLAASLAGSDEFFQIRGGGTNAGFANALYQAALNRPVDAAAQAQIVKVLTTAGPAAAAALRVQVAATVLNDAGDEYRKNLVAGFYQTFLDRSADPGSAAWVGLLHAGVRDETVLAYLLGTPEYYNKTSA